MNIDPSDISLLETGLDMQGKGRVHDPKEYRLRTDDEALASLARLVIALAKDKLEDKPQLATPGIAKEKRQEIEGYLLCDNAHFELRWSDFVEDAWLSSILNDEGRVTMQVNRTFGDRSEPVWIEFELKGLWLVKVGSKIACQPKFLDFETANVHPLQPSC